MDTEDRIGRLRTAEKDLLRIADEIEGCLHMTGLGNRFGDLPDRLRSMASSNDSESIANLVRELEYLSEEHPVWTRPLASVKNACRKDI